MIGINRGPRVFRDRKQERAPRVNEQIRIPQIRLVDKDGEQVGIVETRKAMEMAMEADLDLVEVAPNARPPVCRIMNYGKYRYEQSKKQKKGKKTASQLKEIRLGPRISDHDYEFKIRHAENFLKHRHKVRISVEFRGRQNMYRMQGRELLERAEEDLREVGAAEMPIKDEGRNIVVIIAPK
ncbi:MAG: translation initiation factor IF-3 [Gemmatimonadetes bacterium]|nr:translation initiation factor IF-3 [Gemmatimonadota bacterium]MDE3256565.1 translation initiation factor IF-3 [Gemmatimonadota bacterium]